MKIDCSNIKNILIIQYEPWGDVLINTALFPSIRKKFPEANIEYLVRKPFDNVLNNNPYINNTIVYKKEKGFKYFIDRLKLIILIRRKSYDLIIDQMRGTSSAQLVFFSNANHKLGLQHRRWNFVYNIRPKVKGVRYSASMKFDLLSPLGIKEEPYKLYYSISKSSINYIEKWLNEINMNENNFICFSPGSPVKRKKWNLDNYSKLADSIIENTNLKVILLWGPGEEDDVNYIKNKMKHSPIIAISTNFNQAAALIKKSELLICNDGGINHLSVAVETPSLAMFGSTEPNKWCPEILGIHYYLHNPNVNSRLDDTFGITSQVAFQKVKEILKLENQN